jgi:uncharacterized protein (DUF1015 family)
MLKLGAQTGPVFLTYRARAEIDRIVSAATSGEPLLDVSASDGVRHTLWRADRPTRDTLVDAAKQIPALYIADGHHRAASAARARLRLEQTSAQRGAGGAPDAADCATFLAVAFPHNQVRILPYNRVVRDLDALAPADFLQAVHDRFEVADGGPATPVEPGQLAMYFQRAWRTLRRRLPPPASAARASLLDVSVLQDELLAPVLKIADVRTDARIGFVGGARGTGELERLVDSGRAAVAFSLFPVGVADLMAVCDAGEMMPPKSTWFEPKLRDGLLIHLI